VAATVTPFCFFPFPPHFCHSEGPFHQCFGLWRKVSAFWCPSFFGFGARRHLMTLAVIFLSSAQYPAGAPSSSASGAFLFPFWLPKARRRPPVTAIRLPRFNGGQHHSTPLPIAPKLKSPGPPGSWWARQPLAFTSIKSVPVALVTPPS